MRTSLIVASALAILSAPVAGAATIVTYGITAGGASTPMIIYMDKDLLSGPFGQERMIYRADTGPVIVVDDKTHSYMELSLDEMRKGMAQSDHRKMQQRLDAMPEAQRKQVEAALASGNAPPPPRVVYRKSGPTRTAGQWTCVPFTVLIDDKPISDVCMAKLPDLGLTRDDLRSSTSLAAVQAKWLSQMPTFDQHAEPMQTLDFDATNRAIGFEGFVVQFALKSSPGQPQYTMMLQSVEHKDAPQGAFGIPEGYARQKPTLIGDTGDKP